MSTEIGNFAGDRAVRIEPIEHRGQSGVGVMIRQNGEYVLDAHLPRADFLAAVASELDVIVVDVNGYGVSETSVGAIVSGKALAEPDVTADELDDIGRCYLALARYRRQHPPVDEAEVEALTALLDETHLINRLADADIRALVERGVTVKRGDR